MEIQADSRGAAERKATAAGMDVRHVEEIPEPILADSNTERPGKGKWIILLLILLGALGTAVYLFWDMVREAMR
jgi:hypothetical protein